MIIPTEDIIEEIAIPQNRLNPPLAETLPKLNDLLKGTQTRLRIKCNIQTVLLGVVFEYIDGLRRVY